MQMGHNRFLSLEAGDNPMAIKPEQSCQQDDKKTVLKLSDKFDIDQAGSKIIGYGIKIIGNITDP